MKSNLRFFEVWVPKVRMSVLFLFVLFLPTQLSTFFFAPFSYISGVKVDYLAPAIYLTDMLGVIAIILYAPFIAREVRKSAVLFIFFTGFFLAHAYTSTYPLLALYRLAKLEEIYFIFLIFSHITKPSVFFLPLVVGGIFELSLAIAQLYEKAALQGIFYFFGERAFSAATPAIAKIALAGVEFVRPYGTFSHPNSMGGFYLLLYSYLLTTSSRISLLIKYVGLFITSCLILISFSKIAIGIYAIITLWYFISKEPTRLCRICTISKIAVLTVVSSIFLMGRGDPFSFVKRVKLAKNALSVIQKTGGWGTGLGQYLIYSSVFSSRYLFFFKEPVHNIFLLFLGEAGIIGTIITGYIIYRFAKKNIRSALFFTPGFALITTGMLDHYWLTSQQNILLIAVIAGLATHELLRRDVCRQNTLHRDDKRSFTK